MTDKFLPQFFNALSTQGIRYSVLRNYHHLPNSTGGSDLDILINRKDSFSFFSLLSEICKNQNGKVISIINSDICPRISVLGLNGGGWGLLIDLHYDKICYRGYTILSSRNIWRNTVLYGNVYVLNQKTDAFIGLFKELLNNGTCVREYYDNFKLCARDVEFLTNVCHDIEKAELVPILLDIANRKYSTEEIKRLVRALNKIFPRRGVSFINNLKKFTRILTQPGYTIVFLGTDGSGKTSIINNIKPLLNSAFHNAVYCEHMRPNKFPSIANLTRSKAGFVYPVTNPHGSSTSSFIGSLVRWTYYMFDYTVGFYLKVWPSKAIRSCVWIFDRYYYDYLIDPKRVRIRLPIWILKFGQFVIPEPDIILCLGADAQMIHKRKPELTLCEVERQITELKLFCVNNERAIWIDTGKSINDSSSDALEAIIKVMSKRFENVKLV